MKAAVDVCYRRTQARAAGLIFEDWTDSAPASVFQIRLPPQKPYRPGRFFERELPCLLALLRPIAFRFEAIVIDGYVHLCDEAGKGLGVHLFESLAYSPTIIGVAKNPLKVADRFVPVYRGSSRKPLFVSAIGCPADQAARIIAGMHGSDRIPTLLKQVDRFARSVDPEAA